VWTVAILLVLGDICAAWLLLKYYDEPLRAYLTRKLMARSNERAPNPVLSEA
jgi:hypothetical protein